jgi:transposase
MSRKTDTVVACTIGIDTGKNTLHLIGLDDRGAIVLRQKLTRGRVAARLANVPQCLIGMVSVQGRADYRFATKALLLRATSPW